MTLEDAAVNAEANALAALANNGYIRIKTALDVLLAELRFAATAFGAADAGVITANTIDPVAAGDTGIATKYEAYQSNGTTKLWTGTVSDTSGDMVLNSTNLSGGATVTISSLVHTIPKS